MKIKIVLSLLLMFSATTSSAWTVMVLRGETSGLRGGKNLTLKVGQSLETGDTLKTGADGKIKLAEKSSILVVGEGTSLNLRDAQATEADKSQKIVVDSGKIRVQVDKETAPLYQYTTKSVTAGIRGTDFFLSASAEKENLCVFHGEVKVKAIDLDQEKILKANQGWFKETHSSSKITETTEEQRAKWMKATAIE